MNNLDYSKGEEKIISSKERDREKDRAEKKSTKLLYVYWLTRCAFPAALTEIDRPGELGTS